MRIAQQHNPTLAKQTISPANDVVHLPAQTATLCPDLGNASQKLITFRSQAPVAFLLSRGGEDENKAAGLPA
jgi:hypothetical protein